VALKTKGVRQHGNAHRVRLARANQRSVSPVPLQDNRTSCLLPSNRQSNPALPSIRARTSKGATGLSFALSFSLPISPAHTAGVRLAAIVARVAPIVCELASSYQVSRSYDPTGACDAYTTRVSDNSSSFNGIDKNYPSLRVVKTILRV